MDTKIDCLVPTGNGNQTKSIVNFKLPNTCPICGYGIAPDMIEYSTPLHIRNVQNEKQIGILLQCTHCDNLFFALYEIKILSEATVVSTARCISNLKRIEPNDFTKIPIPEGMKDYYLDFYEIYSQAARAETLGLNKITGIAYRRALEKLVKSYVPEIFPDDKETILSETLSQSIARIKDPKIEALAKAASWIGNDETHEIKKHPDYNVEDMKGFILSLCHLILSGKEADKALSMIDKH
ncbi:hypothetical protein [Megasphaera sueciensis]|uniref:hypothetical protein n=1 Tax=Megasphaera sueciensis TaxID=349094 RepID=UPI003CFC4D7E